MILTFKGFLFDIFLICSLSKSLAFCEFGSVNFEACNALLHAGPICNEKILTCQNKIYYKKGEELVAILTKEINAAWREIKYKKGYPCYSS